MTRDQTCEFDSLQLLQQSSLASDWLLGKCVEMYECKSVFYSVSVLLEQLRLLFAYFLHNY